MILFFKFQFGKGLQPVGFPFVCSPGANDLINIKLNHLVLESTDLIWTVFKKNELLLLVQYSGFITKTCRSVRFTEISLFVLRIVQYYFQIHCTNKMQRFWSLKRMTWLLWKCHYDFGGSSDSVKTWYRVDGRVNGFRFPGRTILRPRRGLDHLIPHLATRLKKE
jgi:hypothetical protein